MNKKRKVDLLYKKAKNRPMDASSEELKELHKYKVVVNEPDFVTTRQNIQDYISAVDNNGCNIPFYDWCLNNKRADRRRTGSSEQEIEQRNQTQGLGTMLFIGWLTWGLAIYWILQGALPAEICAILGAITSYFIYRRSRASAALTIFMLPLILAALFGMMALK